MSQSDSKPETKPVEGPAATPDPTRRRQPDEVLFATMAGAPAVVLCGHAGKEGKKRNAASVGATLCWLVEPHLNNLLARFERHGAVKAIEAFMGVDGKAGVAAPELGQQMLAAHLAGHAAYVDEVVPRLDDAQRTLWTQRFGAEAEPSKQKHGNGAVSEPKSVKCLHALTAAALGGAPNAVGCAVAKYIAYLASPAVSLRCTAGGTATAAAQADGVDATKDDAAAVAPTDIDNIESFFTWLKTTGPAAFSFGEGGAKADVPRVCESAAAILVAVEGHAPRARKKHRIN